jgi:hypothetical protein
VVPARTFAELSARRIVVGRAERKASSREYLETQSKYGRPPACFRSFVLFELCFSWHLKERLTRLSATIRFLDKAGRPPSNVRDDTHLF